MAWTSWQVPQQVGGADQEGCLGGALWSVHRQGTENEHRLPLPLGDLPGLTPSPFLWQGKQEGPEWDESGLRTQRPRPAFSSLSLSLPGSIPIAMPSGIRFSALSSFLSFVSFLDIPFYILCLGTITDIRFYFNGEF